MNAAKEYLKQIDTLGHYAATKQTELDSFNNMLLLYNLGRDYKEIDTSDLKKIKQEAVNKMLGAIKQRQHIIDQIGELRSVKYTNILLDIYVRGYNLK
ncbi:hypothetical protein IJ556_04620, partial [bacterium]|nr:hypothetical protein [bacterium]